MPFMHAICDKLFRASINPARNVGPVSQPHRYAVIIDGKYTPHGSFNFACDVALALKICISHTYG